MKEDHGRGDPYGVVVKPHQDIQDPEDDEHRGQEGGVQQLPAPGDEGDEIAAPQGEEGFTENTGCQESGRGDHVLGLVAEGQPEDQHG